MSDDTSFQSNLVRRVHNMALGPSTPSNALVPVFEAVYNAIHAIQDRFGNQWCERGKIEITLIDLDSSRPSFQVRDNGIGLDEQNYNSFRTYDSDHKARRGGKGLGRLSWLKVFEEAGVDSIFEKENKRYKRHFVMQLDNDRPLAEYSLHETSDLEPGTSILLRDMKQQYARHVPKGPETIARRIIAHFLPYLISSVRPSVVIETADETIDLATYLKEKEVKLGHLDIPIEGHQALRLDHNLLEKNVVEGKAAHKIYFAAHGRVVSEFDIGLALGLTTYIDRSGRSYAYAGVLSGDLLDESVNSERTALDLDPELLELIKRKTFETIKNVLSPQIERVIEKQADLTRNIVKKYPRYAYLVGDAKDFVLRKIPRNFRTAEQIYQQLALFDFRDNREIERKVEALSKTEPKEDDPVETGVQDLLGRLTAHEFSVLADYTVRRKIVLDLLERRLGYKPDGTMKHHSEQALHSFIVPMRVENGDIRVNKHNLWIIDDKLSYYEYWASDKKLKKIISEHSSSDRPDVLLFAGRSAYHRPGTDQPVVIVEFKKPARNDYDEEENPFVQIYGYIDELREGKVLDKEGGVIQEVSESTPFFCYVVADFTPNMRRWLKLAQISVPLPGGGGFYGYNPEYKAFVQAVSYKYVLKDARLRNEAFFKQLNI
ncbi:ATP-binding protein [Rhizobium daejeonense]